MENSWIDVLNMSTKNPENINSELLIEARWGHACCAIGDSLYIIGGYNGNYLGDMWVFKFGDFKLEQLVKHGDYPALKRSNHTVCHYPRTNMMYLFGGGTGTTINRYNSTISISLYSPLEVRTLEIEGMLPAPRTYHSACILSNYMVISGGEGHFDLNDIWALNLDTYQWILINTHSNLLPRRFHSSISYPGNKIYIYAGCHLDYQTLGDMWELDFTEFIKSNSAIVEAKEVNVRNGEIPQSRWGMTGALSPMNHKLYYFGGKCKNGDFNDLWAFSPSKSTWKQGGCPNPRRRAAGGFIGSSLVIFGGFDNSFYKDLHMISLSYPENKLPKVVPLTYILKGMFNNPQSGSDIKLMVSEYQQPIYLHRGVIMGRVEGEDANTQLFTLFKGAENDYVVLNMATAFPNGLLGEDMSMNIYTEEYIYQMLLGVFEYLYFNSWSSFEASEESLSLLISFTKEIGMLNLCKTIEKIHLGIIQEKENLVELEKKADEFRDDENYYNQLINYIHVREAEIDKFIKWGNEERIPRIKSEEDLLSMENQGGIHKYYDINLICNGGVVLKGNRALLANRAKYFNALHVFSEGKSKLVKFMDIDVNALGFISYFIYTNHFLSLDGFHNLQILLEFSIWVDYFRVGSLINVCTYFINKFMNECTAEPLYAFGYIFNFPKVSEHAGYYMALNEECVSKEDSDGSSLRTLTKDIRSLLDISINYYKQQKVGLIQFRKKKEENEELFYTPETSNKQSPSCIRNESIMNKRINREIVFSMIPKEHVALKEVDRNISKSASIGGGIGHLPNMDNVPFPSDHMGDGTNSTPVPIYTNSNMRVIGSPYTPQKLKEFDFSLQGPKMNSFQPTPKVGEVEKIKDMNDIGMRYRGCKMGINRSEEMESEIMKRAGLSVRAFNGMEEEVQNELQNRIIAFSSVEDETDEEEEEDSDSMEDGSEKYGFNPSMWKSTK